MKSVSLVGIAVLAACASQGQCASVIVESFAHPGGVAYAVFLDGGADNGNFNVVEFTLRPSSAAAPFINQDAGQVAGEPRLPGSPFSFLNRGLPLTFDAPAEELEIGDWPKLGPKNLPTEVGFATGPLGQNIDTGALPGGRLFLANVMLGSAEAKFHGRLLAIGDGSLLQNIVIPEPAAGVMALVCAGAALVVRRRS